MIVQGGSTYILTNKNFTTLYTGSTVDINSRYIEHKEKLFPNSFSSRYNLNVMVFIKVFSTIQEARFLEKYIKGKSRMWKIELIEKGNPNWINLGEVLDTPKLEEHMNLYDDQDFGFV